MSPNTPPAVWHLSLFGTLCLTDPNHTRPPVSHFRTQRSATLLACLAVSAHPMRRETLADQLWPDEEAEVGRRRLRQEIATLRRQLEPAPLLLGSVLQAVGQDTIALSPDAVQTDVALFEKLCQTAEREARRGNAAHAHAAWEQAVLLYGNDGLLPHQYDDFFVPHRERLRHMQELACRHMAPFARSPKPAAVSACDEPRPEKSTPEKSRTRFSPEPARLPLTMGRFFGRKTEINQIHHLLRAPDGARVITLVGTGGSGKTRLVIEVLRALPPEEAKTGLCCAGFVLLADSDAASPGALLQAVWDAVRRPAPLASPPLPPTRENIVRVLREQTPLNGRVILVWDNAEHVAQSVAALCATLLADVPALVCLVTSRTRLLLDSEHEVMVDPLPLPGDDMPPADAALVESVALFCDRARAIRPDFALTERTAVSVCAICRLLDGIPLALELCAARTYTLGIVQIREQLRADLLHLLTVSAQRPGVLERHRVLAGTIDWSLGLLSQATVRVFAALSVFRGGFTSEAASFVCTNDGDNEDSRAIPEALMLLRLHCLILPVSVDFADAPRFRLLETLREAGAARLTRASREEAQSRHAAYFLRHAEALLPPDEVTGREAYLDILQTDAANFDAALHWAAQNDFPSFNRLVAALCPFWQARGLFPAMRQWTNAVLDAAPSGAANHSGRIMAYAGMGAFHAGDFAAACAGGDAGRILCQAQNDGYGAALCALVCGSAKNYQGQTGAARELFLQALHGFRRAKARRSEADALIHLGMADGSVAEYEGAHAYYQAALVIARALHDEAMTATLLVFLCDWNNCTNQFDQAAFYADAAREIVNRLNLEHTRTIACCTRCVYLTETNQFADAKEAGVAAFVDAQRLFIGWVQPFTAEALAQWCAAQEKWEPAAALFGLAEAVRKTMGAPIPPAYQMRHARYLARTRAALGKRFARPHRALQSKNTAALIAFVNGL